MSVDMKTTKDGHEYLEFTTGSGYVLGSRKNKKKVSEKRLVEIHNEVHDDFMVLRKSVYNYIKKNMKDGISMTESKNITSRDIRYLIKEFK